MKRVNYLIFIAILSILIIFLLFYSNKLLLTGYTVFPIQNSSVQIIEIDSNLIPYEHKILDLDILRELKIKKDVEVIVNLNKNRERIRGFSRNKVVEEFSSGGFVAKINKNDLTTLLSSEAVESIEPIRYFDINLQDSIVITNASVSHNRQIYDVNLSGIGKTVCVIDTGIDFSHPDLAQRNVLGCNLYCAGSGACNLNCNENDLNGHGTHVAGIIAASGGITGFSPKVGLIGLKVFQGSSGSGATTTALRRAIDWCSDNFAQYNISVISISISSSSLFSNCCDSSFASLRNSIQQAVSRNISVVASTGNNFNPIAIGAPACICSTIPVSATNKNDSLASYANYAPSIQRLVAPGTNINSTCSSYASNSPYCIMTGTSMSAPSVSGSIALLGQVSSSFGIGMTPKDFEMLLNRTAFKITRSDGDIFSRINVDKAVLELDSLSPEIHLVNPPNGYRTANTNVSFFCNATDWQLNSINFYLFSSGISEEPIYEETRYFNNVSYVLAHFNVSNLQGGDYLWSCSGSDARGNFAYASENQHKLGIGGISVYLNSPRNNIYLNKSEINLSCLSTTPQGIFINHSIIYVYNPENVTVFESIGYAGLQSTSFLFNTTFYPLNDGFYSWNCKGVINPLDYAWAESNYTFYLDRVSPILLAIYPEDNAIFNLDDMPIDFNFYVQDNLPLNCSLYVNNEKINSSYFNSSGEFNFSHRFGIGNYDWYISCIDLASNSNFSELRAFDVNFGGSIGGGSGSGSGGGGGGGGPGGGGAASQFSRNRNDSTGESGGGFGQKSGSRGQNNDSSFEAGRDVDRGIITGRAIFDFTKKGLTFFGWILFIILLLFLVYRYLNKLNYKNKTQIYKERNLIKLKNQKNEI